MKNRDLGMNRPITRRDFVGGVAVAISGSMAWRWSEAGAPAVSYEQRQVHANTYPPIRTGMRGSHEGSYEVAHRLRDGVRWDSPEESGEQYDLIVVGGGLSGLAAAHGEYRESQSIQQGWTPPDRSARHRRRALFRVPRRQALQIGRVTPRCVFWPGDVRYGPARGRRRTTVLAQVP